MIVIVWINSSHFQDTQSGYNINDITFQEGFNFHCLSGGALDRFVIAFFLIIMLLFHNEPLTHLEILFLWWFPHTFKVYESKKFLSSIPNLMLDDLHDGSRVENSLRNVTV